MKNYTLIQENTRQSSQQPLLPHSTGQKYSQKVLYIYMPSLIVAVHQQDPLSPMPFLLVTGGDCIRWFNWQIRGRSPPLFDTVPQTSCEKSIRKITLVLQWMFLIKTYYIANKVVVQPFISFNHHLIHLNSGLAYINN